MKHRAMPQAPTLLRVLVLLIIFFTEYNVQGYSEVEELLKKEGICIAVTEKLIKDSGVAIDSIYEKIVERLKSRSMARGSLLCSNAIKSAQFLIIMLYTHSSVHKHTHKHTYTHVHMHQHKHLHIQTHTPTHTNIHTYTQTVKHTQTSTHTYTHLHTQTCKHTHKHTHTYTHKHTQTHTHIHTQTYTHTHFLALILQLFHFLFCQNSFVLLSLIYFYRRCFYAAVLLLPAFLFLHNMFLLTFLSLL